MRFKTTNLPTKKTTNVDPNEYTNGDRSPSRRDPLVTTGVSKTFEDRPTVDSVEPSGGVRDKRSIDLV